MCGIVGYSGSYAADKLKTSLNLLLHRGPDSNGQFIDNAARIGLAHARLSILDVSDAGRQPMSYENLIISYNGEIYNFVELREELIAKGHQFKSKTDTEVILRLYREHGKDMLQYLDGIFAFAIWNKVDEELFIARDGFGIKPLYYLDDKNGFAFGSEVKSLLPFISDRQLDETAIDSYLKFLWCPGKRTPFKNIKKLSPGHAMVVRQGSIKSVWQWYNLPTSKSVGLSKENKRSIINQTSTVLREAVHRQMISDVPVGAFLSGGLDSSSVVCFAREINKNIQCFTIDDTIGGEIGSTPDLPYARRVAKHLGVDLNVINMEPTKLAEHLKKMVYHLDEPISDPAPLNALFISQLARESGIKVLLSGAGGDDILTGYRRHLALNANYWLKFVPSSFLAVATKGFEKFDFRKPIFRKFSKFLDGASLGGAELLINYFRWAKTTHLQDVYTSDFKKHISECVGSQVMHEYINTIDQELPQLEKMLLLEQRFFLADHNLIYTDKMSMASGVEVRVPFLDKEFVTFAAGIPVGLKQSKTQAKWILKEAMKPFLPHDIIYRPKTGFGLPIRRWIHNDLSEFVNDTLNIDTLKKRNIFSFDELQKLIIADKNGKIDASYLIFSMLCLELWMQNFIDQ